MSDLLSEAMVFTGSQQAFTKQTSAVPVPEDGQVLVKITYTTICTSDLHTYFGRRKSPEPSILGHEIIGRVANLAPGGAKDYKGNALKIGDLITWTVYAHDHNEEIAQKGFPQKSRSLFKYGHQKLDETTPLSGGFASHCLLRKGTDIFKLPENLTNREAAPLNCTHATIAGALRLAGNLDGKNVLIIGAGMLGLSACAMSKEQGAKNIYSLDLDHDRAKAALEFGATKAFSPETISKSKNGEGVDVVIETSGSPVAIENAIDLLNIGGRMVLVGSVFKQRDLNINAEKIVRNILTISGLHNYAPIDLYNAIEFLQSNNHKYPFQSLIQKDFLLTDLDDAFAEATQQNHYRVGVYQD